MSKLRNFENQRAPIGPHRLSLEKKTVNFNSECKRKILNSAAFTSFFRVVWWNGGGKMVSKIENNPVLIKL